MLHYVNRLATALIALEWLWLLLLLPLVVFIRPGFTPVLLLLPALWLGRKLVHGRFVPATPLDGALLLLLFMLLVSLYATFDMAFSLDKIAGLAFGVAVFYATVAAAGRSQRHLLAGVSLYLLLGVAVAALGLLGTQWSRKLPLLRDITAQLPQRLLTLPGADAGFNPNQVAGVLLWVAPLALAVAYLLLLHPNSLGGRLRRGAWLLSLLASAAVAAFLLGVTVLTQSRGGLIGLALAVAFVLLAATWLRSWRLLLGIGLLLGLVAGDVVYHERLEQWTAVLPAGTLDGVTPAGAITSLEGRIEIWSRAIYGLQDFPFTGMGIGTFRRVVPILYPLFLISPTTDIAHAHNHLLQTGLDLGIPGLIAYAAVWLVTGAMLWQTWRQSRLLWSRTLVIGFAGSLLGYFVYGLTDAVALGAKPGFLFWILLGLVAALHLVVVRRPAVEVQREMAPTPPKVKIPAPAASPNA
jgi:putative inorganic carbon (hco3(-)) transporter